MPRAFAANVVQRDAYAAGADLQDQRVRPVGLKVTNRSHAMGLAPVCPVDHLRPKRGGHQADGFPEIEEDRLKGNWIFKGIGSGRGFPCSPLNPD